MLYPFIWHISAVPEVKIGYSRSLQSDLGLNLVNVFAFSVSMTTSKAATKPGGEIRYNFLFRSVRCSKGSLYYFQKL